MPRTTTTKTAEDRYGVQRYLIVRDSAPDTDRALICAMEDILTHPPNGHHLWSVKVQRSDRGKRTTVEVWWREDWRKENLT